MSKSCHDCIHQCVCEMIDSAEECRWHEVDTPLVKFINELLELIPKLFEELNKHTNAAPPCRITMPRELPIGVSSECRSVTDGRLQTIESRLSKSLDTDHRRISDVPWKSGDGVFVSEDCIHCRPEGEWSARGWAEGFPVGARVHCHCGIVLYIERHTIRAIRDVGPVGPDRPNTPGPKPGEKSKPA